jgi:4-hydroxy-tetrahydrodipicolinate synthase
MSSNQSTVEQRALLVPMIAPLDERGRLDHASYRRHVGHVIDSGATGLWVNGTSGDFHALCEEDLVETIGIARSVIGKGVPLVAHMGDTATGRVVERARRAMDAGADHIAAITPYYTDYTEAEIVCHHARIAEATGRGVYIYQHPATGKAQLAVETIIEMAQRGICIGIKESGSDLESFRQLVRRSEETGCGLRTFHGVGGHALETLLMRSSGIITVLANLVPRTCSDLCLAVGMDRLDEAERLQLKMRLLAGTLSECLSRRTTSAPSVAAMKFILKELGMYTHDVVPEPLEPLHADEKVALLARVLPLVKDELDPSS